MRHGAYSQAASRPGGAWAAHPLTPTTAGAATPTGSSAYPPLGAQPAHHQVPPHIHSSHHGAASDPAGVSSVSTLLDRVLAMLDGFEVRLPFLSLCRVPSPLLARASSAGLRGRGPAATRLGLWREGQSASTSRLARSQGLALCAACLEVDCWVSRGQCAGLERPGRGGERGPLSLFLLGRCAVQRRCEAAGDELQLARNAGGSAEPAHAHSPQRWSSTSLTSPPSPAGRHGLPALPRGDGPVRPQLQTVSMRVPGASSSLVCLTPRAPSLNLLLPLCSSPADLQVLLPPHQGEPQQQVPGVSHALRRRDGRVQGDQARRVRPLLLPPPSSHAPLVARL